MNVVVDDAEEIYVGKNAAGRPNRSLGMLGCQLWDVIIINVPVLGRILLKGDSITLIQPASS